MEDSGGVGAAPPWWWNLTLGGSGGAEWLRLCYCIADKCVKPLRFTCEIAHIHHAYNDLIPLELWVMSLSKWGNLGSFFSMCHQFMVKLLLFFVDCWFALYPKVVAFSVMLSKLILIFWNLLLKSVCNELKTEEWLFYKCKASLAFPSPGVRVHCRISASPGFWGSSVGAVPWFWDRLWADISLVQIQEPQSSVVLCTCCSHMVVMARSILWRGDSIPGRCLISLLPLPPQIFPLVFSYSLILTTL